MAKRKQPVCRAWRVPRDKKPAFWRAMLVNGELWIRSHMSTTKRAWHLSRGNPMRGWEIIALGHQIETYERDYIELHPREAARLNAQRIEEMGRKK